jgi:aldehyde:ferredoxin oxidoreductase
MYGCHGRILHIDLTRRQTTVETPTPEIYQTWIGGKGLASWLLWRDNPRWVDPLASANRLIFAAGPFTGTRIWGGCRYGVFSKSPQTGIYAESYSGGRVPEALDAAGYDAVVIHGAGEHPVALVIDPDGVKFHAAVGLWGLDTYAAEDGMHELAGPLPSGFKRGAVVIGPAGERLIRFAVIENDYWRSAGRTGMGAVMGAKRLKGILFQGDRSRLPADPGRVRELARQLADVSRDHPGVQAYKRLGTPMMVKIMNEAGAFPTRYWSRGVFTAWPRISAAALHERCHVKPRACLKCFMACGRATTVRQGRHAGLEIEGPEYETIYAFGGLCQVDSIEEIAWINDRCDRLGMDTITAGNLCAFTIEAVRRGRVAYAVNYGDADGIAALLGDIAARRGIGAVLAEGIRVAAAAWDMEDVAVHVKGMEPAGYDPRVLKGMGLGYATSDRGACHLRATFYKAELSGMIDPDRITGKAKLFVDFEDRLTIFDCLILCRFYRDLYDWEALAELVRAVTGLDVDVDALRRTAGRITDLVRRFNLREGMNPAVDDRLPQRLHRRLEDSGKQITPGELEMMLADYYHLRGWNGDGIPPAPGGDAAAGLTGG